ncbi:MAG: aminotransferase class IV [Saprospiraceae bacterium]|nr:aminotransferase class IV [Saprospiraceae bacterium]
MSPWVETIWIRHGRVQNLRYHQARFDATRRAHYESVPPISLSPLISRNHPTADTKCRILYTDTILDIQYSPYEWRSIRTLAIVEQNTITYPYKSLHRPELDTLFSRRGSADEILILRNGLFTDAYYFNIVFKNDNGLFTPKTPLLPGTMRQKLIDSGIIRPMDISVDDLPKYHSIHLINAFNPLGRSQGLGAMGGNYEWGNDELRMV